MTIDGIANGREIVLGHPKTREAMRAGLAMYFVTLDDPELMRVGNTIVADLGIEHFFNIQLVGDYVIEINPRISTIVYQEDLNIPYLGVKRAIGEISEDELRALRVAHPPGPHGAALLRPARVRLMTARDEPCPRDCPRDMTLRVTHCPVNVAGIPWENVQALRRKGIDARLVVFERGKLHPEADVSLDRHGPLPQRLAQQFAAFARLAPKTDVFHFYFGLTLVPKSLQFPLLRALRKKSVFHYLGSDIRGKSPRRARVRQARRRRDRRLLRRDPLGARGARDPARARPDAVHARAAVGQPPAARRARAVEPREEGDALGDRGVRAAATSSSTSSRASRTTRRASATRAPTSSSTS